MNLFINCKGMPVILANIIICSSLNPENCWAFLSATAVSLFNFNIAIKNLIPFISSSVYFKLFNVLP